MRYLQKNLIADLKEKMVLLAGPRQCGKTTYSKSLLDKKGVYLNWDIPADRKIIREMSWPKDASLIILDELHKAPKWKNYLKGIADQFKNSPPILVTGSARLDSFKTAGDALTGRHYFYRLHPFDLYEAAKLYPKMSLQEIAIRLMNVGGFPESFLNPNRAPRLRTDRMELVLKEDLKDISKISSVAGAYDLVELLRERVGKPINYDNLSQTLSCSPPTIKNWITLLEKLYIVFLLRPYSPSGSVISIRKEKRLFFYDSSAAYDETLGAQLENLVACTLLKYTHYKKDTTGDNWELFYLRDKQKREVDFVLVKNRKIEKLIEVKSSGDEINLGLKYYHERLKPKESLLLVLNLSRPLEKSGIKIKPLAEWIANELWQ